MREVELKSVVPDPGRTIAALRAAGAALACDGRQSDARYDTPDRALVARDHVLRLRVFTGTPAPSATLDWKGPTSVVGGYKVREELSSSTGDAGVLAQMLDRLGYVVIREIQRDIVQFAWQGATIRVERYPRMDALMEVEGEPAAIEAAIAGAQLARSGFTSERLQDFVARFELRTGQRAALCDRELAGDYRYSTDA
ncbi:MAG: CYTH domain-containing protein [Gemmatimonadaceae bacterium]